MRGTPGLVAALRSHARTRGSHVALTFLHDGKDSPLTFAELDARAQGIANMLRSRYGSGDRALLLFEPGLDYAAAFFGCLYAGVIAVPSYPPQAWTSRSVPRLRAIVEDAKPTVVLTTEALLPHVRAALPSDADAPGFLVTDALVPSSLESFELPNTSDVAFLQYTSGSTGKPKGVVLSHDNLAHNAAAIARAMGMDDGSTGVIWLPPYHDMGLIGGILVPVLTGSHVVLMSPFSFLKNPLSWFEAISKYRARVSGGPNFAYDLCVRRAEEGGLPDLDLSCWEVAFTGAEPVRPETLARFEGSFAKAGFSPRAWFMCYGLAEATLMVTGSEEFGAGARLWRVDKELFQRERRAASAGAESVNAMVLVGCGRSLPDQRVSILHPHDPRDVSPRPDGVEGEICVEGPSVAQGYWNKDEETRHTFGSVSVDGRPLLRTGDLGLLHDGELFITGRLKDVIILAGQNHHPQDIEAAVDGVHPSLRVGGAAAFSIDLDGSERLVVVLELTRLRRRERRVRVDLTQPHRRRATDRIEPKPDAEGGELAPGPEAEKIRDHYFVPVDMDEVTHAVLDKLRSECGVSPYAVLLVASGGIPKTSSGKVQRGACKTNFLSGKLDIRHRWIVGDPAFAVAASIVPPSRLPSLRPPQPAASLLPPASPVDVLLAWLRDALAVRLRTTPNVIDPDAPLALLGLNSIDAIGMAGELSQRLGRSITPTVFWEYRSLRDVARGLADMRQDSLVPGREAESDLVAIVGMACRFPGAPDLRTFWSLLCDGRDAISEVPKERWDHSRFGVDERLAKGGLRYGGFVEGIADFEPEFFGISPREAERIDPQQRLLLETTWHALEDAGIDPRRLSGSLVGVFVGISNADYARRTVGGPPDPHAGTGSALSIAANRISYQFDFRGPSMTVDTACSSSMVALHLACGALRRGEANVAIAGGVNLVLDPDLSAHFATAGFLSADGRCKAFDARANGYVRSEGVGLVILKPLTRALADGDRIYAVVAGSAVNQDGRSNGLTAPNQRSQEGVLREAYQRAGVAPSDVVYVEAHGTGTALGDPIEAAALGRVLAKDRPPEHKCLLGSVKTNIGHLEAAAGIAGVIKVALALHRKKIPPSLHFERPNPYIDFNALPLRVITALEEWPAHLEPIAGVSSFGFGGTNAHAVLRGVDAPLSFETTFGLTRSTTLVALSAESEASLTDLARSYVKALSDPDAPSLASIAKAAGLRRTHLKHRLAIRGSSKDEVVALLSSHLAGRRDRGIAVGKALAAEKRSVVFVFTGQGAQWPRMGHDLIATEPVYLQTLTSCDAVTRESAGFSILEELELAEDASRLSDTAVAQACIVAVELALVAILARYGIRPAAVIGHSVGEITAAVVAGAISEATGMRLACERGRRMGEARGGRMVAFAASASELARRVKPFGDELAIAAENSPSSTVVAGTERAIQELVHALARDGVAGKDLGVPYAFHSRSMAGVADAIDSFAEGLLASSPSKRATLPWYSTVSGERVSRAASSHWGAGVRGTVRFSAAVASARADGHVVFVEVGPHPALGAPLAQCLDAGDAGAVHLSTLRRGRPGVDGIFDALATLYTLGINPEFSALPGRATGLDLPLYPWKKRRLWLEAGEGRPGVDHVELCLATKTHVWHIQLNELHALLTSHRVQRVAVLPAAAYVDLVLARVATLMPQSFPPSMRARNVEFVAPMMVSEGSTRVLQVIVTDEPAGYRFRVASRPTNRTGDGGGWTLHATGLIEYTPAPTAGRPGPPGGGLHG